MNRGTTRGLSKTGEEVVALSVRIENLRQQKIKLEQVCSELEEAESQLGVILQQVEIKKVSNERF
jgi:hypothetical protein